MAAGCTCWSHRMTVGTGAITTESTGNSRHSLLEHIPAFHSPRQGASPIGAAAPGGRHRSVRCKENCWQAFRVCGADLPSRPARPGQRSSQSHAHVPDFSEVRAAVRGFRVAFLQTSCPSSWSASRSQTFLSIAVRRHFAGASARVGPWADALADYGVRQSPAR